MEVDKRSRFLYKVFFRSFDRDNEFLHQLWLSDEAHFHKDGRVNSLNFRFWSTQAPDLVAEAPLHSVKCTAWCAMSSSGIIGPFWFENDAGESHRQCSALPAILAKLWTALNRRLGGDSQLLDQSFQDGASAHTAFATREWLQNRFGSRVISYREVWTWPPHSPALIPLDFFLWGHLKS